MQYVAHSLPVLAIHRFVATAATRLTRLGSGSRSWGGGGEKAKANKRKKKSYQVLCNERRDGARGWNGKIGKKALSAATTEAHLRTTSKEREEKSFLKKTSFSIRAKTREKHHVHANEIE